MTCACSGREKGKLVGGGGGNLKPSPASLPSQHGINWLLARAASYPGSLGKCDGACCCHRPWGTIVVSCCCEYSGSKQHRRILLHCGCRHSYMNLTGPKRRCQQGCVPSGNSWAELEALSFSGSRGCLNS